ncbi:hypothetical protein QE363_000860 [Sphingomonas sp. SORGH_AS870]|uniref:hypothetical protein n=1 Tax=Sphingomonas sp. SORGH_AS_0870 TaxID=3041801 RepID=UPI002855428B|nr:hypothetical protein [Sphingomonas sp. SORGH_AS_0870]MDR6145067.1 hypothetical protein [Sphingomonas sp. SORGH_AS_0870]
MTEYVEQLEGQYRRTTEQLALYRRACASPVLDLAALCAARHGLLSASTARAKFLQTEIYPLILRGQGDAFAARIEELDRDLAVKRRLSSGHIAQWSTAAVQADWPGYKVASAQIVRLVETRLTLEKAVILPALRTLAMRRVA